MPHVKAIETVGKVLILVPTLIALVLLIYANVTGKSVSAGCSGFCIGTTIVCAGVGRLCRCERILWKCKGQIKV